MSRTDPHSLGNFQPADYAYVFSYSLATTEDGWPVPSFNIDAIVALRRGGAVFASHGGTGQCTICGARFVYGDVWKHEPSGVFIHVGHTCADKYDLAADRAEFARLRGAAINRALRAERRRQMAVAARAFVRATPGLAVALRCSHGITRDLVSKLMEYGSLSPAQVALAFKLAREERERAERAANEPVWVAMPEALLGGRVRVRGLVLMTKWKETNFGGALKMLLQVEAEGGAFKLWGTVPAALDSDELRGSVVEFDAKLERSRDDAAFGFFSRPTKAAVVSPAPAVAAA